MVDLDPWEPMDDRGLTALRAAASAFESAGGELVVAVEEPEARAALAGAGLMRAVPPAPGPPEGDADAPLRDPDRPRWEHEFTFPATTRQLRAARRRVAAFAEVAGLDGADLFELSVAVAEALANAVVHGSPHGADDDVRVRFFCYEDEVAVEVVDGGVGHGGVAHLPAARRGHQRTRHPLHARAGRRRALHVRAAGHAGTVGQAAVVSGGDGVASCPASDELPGTGTGPATVPRIVRGTGPCLGGGRQRVGSHGVVHARGHEGRLNERNSA